jgi:hypothetical protein
MNKTVKLCSIGILGLFSGLAIADKPSVIVQLANETAKLSLTSQTEWVQEIYRIEGGFQFDNDKNYALDASVLYKNKGLADPNLDIGFKGKLAYINMDKPSGNTFGALLGVQGAYWLPTRMPSALVAEYLFGPKILTTGDGDSMSEINIRYQMQLMTNLSGYVGYRQFKIKMENGPDIDFDDGAHIGIELSF